MRTYSIHLNSMKDYFNLYRFTRSFRLEAWVAGDGFMINLSSFADIMSICPIDDVELILDQYNEEEVIGIDEFLTASGLLNNMVSFAPEFAFTVA